MTELLDRAFDRALALTPDLQDEIARMIPSFAGDIGQTVPSTSEERAAVKRSLKAAARCEFATDAEIQAVRAKYGP